MLIRIAQGEAECHVHIRIRNEAVHQVLYFTIYL